MRWGRLRRASKKHRSSQGVWYVKLSLATALAFNPGQASAATACATRENPATVLSVIVLEQQVLLLRQHTERRILRLSFQFMSFAKLQEIPILARSNRQTGEIVGYGACDFVDSLFCTTEGLSAGVRRAARRCSCPSSPLVIRKWSAAKRNFPEP